MAGSILADDARIVSWELYALDMTRATQRLLDLCSRIESLATSKMTDDEFGFELRQKCAKDLIDLTCAFVHTLPDEVFRSLEEHWEHESKIINVQYYRSDLHNKFEDECVRFVEMHYPSLRKEDESLSLLLCHLHDPKAYDRLSCLTSPATEIADALSALNDIGIRGIIDEELVVCLERALSVWPDGFDASPLRQLISEAWRLIRHDGNEELQGFDSLFELFCLFYAGSCSRDAYLLSVNRYSAYVEKLANQIVWAVDFLLVEAASHYRKLVTDTEGESPKRADRGSAESSMVDNTADSGHLLELVGDKGRPRARYAGQEYDLTGDQALMLNALIDADGDWVSLSGLGISKPWRVKQNLPEHLKALIEASSGKGHRLRLNP